MAKPGYWSATQINTANYCTMRYYLRYGIGAKPLRLSAYVKGSWLHGLIENFWKKLGTPEEIKRNKKGSVTSKKKYSTKEEFIKFARGKWQRIIIADKNSENKITWRFDDEPWVISGSVGKVCGPLYDLFAKEGPPLYTELPFEFEVEGYRLKGKIDEIRKDGETIIVRDYKSGRPWIGDMKLEHDPQLTIYNAGLCSLIYADKELAVQLGVSDLERFMQDCRYTSPDIESQFFMIEALCVDPKKVHTIPEAVHSTRRTDQHFLAVIKMIEGTEKDIFEKNVYPEWGKKCDDCDLRLVCNEESKKIGTGRYVDKKGQSYMDFILPAYMRKPRTSSHDFSMSAPLPEEPPEKQESNQKKFRYRAIKTRLPR